MENRNSVRYLIDYRDSRKRARIEAVRAERRAQRRTLAVQMTTAIGWFAILVMASGVLRG